MDGGASIMLIMAAMAAASAKMQGDAARKNARQQADFARKEALNQQQVMQHNAEAKSQEAYVNYKRGQVAEAEEARKHDIALAAGRAMAGASGLTVPGTTMERLLEQEADASQRDLDLFDFDITNQYLADLNGASAMYAEAINVGNSGVATANLQETMSVRSANASEVAGYMSAAGYAAGAGIKQYGASSGSSWNTASVKSASAHEARMGRPT